MKIKSIDVQVAKGGQTVRWLEYLDIDGRKVRIDIKTDSYKFQGHCYIEVLDKETLKWNSVVFRPPLTMVVDPNLGYGPDIKIRDVTKDFASDRKWLLDTYGKLIA